MTAEKFINDSSFLTDIFTDEFNKSILIDKFIEFAKLHVKAALKEMVAQQYDRVSSEEVLEELLNDTIKNTYPLTQIK